MRRRKHGRAIVLAAGIVGGLALLAQSVTAKPPLPSAAGQSPQAARFAKLPAPPQPGRPSKAELVSRCQQRPACQAKLQLALKGSPPPIVRPAASGPSRQELELRKLPSPTPPPIPRRFLRSGLGVGPREGFLAWLDPFRVTDAEAQPAFSAYLTPQNTGSLPGPTLELYYPVCGSLTYGHLICTFAPGLKTGDPDFEGTPGVLAEFVAPAARWYIVNFQAAAVTPMKLRHQSGGPIIETWDQAVCDSSTCNYLTAEFLQQGQHNFYLYVPPPYGPSWIFWSVSIESYP